MQQGLDFIKEQHRFDRGRLRFEWFVISLVFLILLGRAYWMMVVRHDFWQSHRQQRFSTSDHSYTPRAALVDKYGESLAQSVPSYSVGYHPMQQSQRLTASQKETLSRLVGENWEQFMRSQGHDKKFIYLNRNIILDPKLQYELKKIPGIEIFSNQKRIYPMGPAGAQLTGYLSFDQKGAEGLERAFEDRLKSYAIDKSPHSMIYRDAKQRWMRCSMDYPVTHDASQELKLTLDNRISALLYQSLAKAFQDYKVAAYSAAVISVEDGSLLACVSYPSFDPAENTQYDSRRRLRPLLDLYEVGSVMKPFSMAAILEDWPAVREISISTEPGEIVVQKHPITDVTKRRSFDFPQILVHSSNIALVKALHAYPPKPSLLQRLKDIGLNQRTGLPFEGEPSPLFPRNVKHKSLDEAVLSFGYGSQMSLLQLARSYLLFARTQGPIPPIHVLYDEQDLALSSFSPHMSEQTRAEIKKILKRVVEEGSARKAYRKDLSIAGKTGTAKRVGEQGYEDRYHAFFIGFFPAEQPKYILAIHADDPQGKIYGGEVCAPLAKELSFKIAALPSLDAMKKP